MTQIPRHQWQALCAAFILFGSTTLWAADLPQEACGRTFPTACATMVSITSSGNMLTIVLSNGIDGSDPEFADSFIGKILLKFAGSVSQPSQVMVAVDGTSLDWKIRNPTDRLGMEWDIELSKRGRGGTNGIAPGETATIVMKWDDGSPPSESDYEEFGVQIQAIGDDDYSDWAVVPEPATILLLASGLAGIGGAGLFRRRRQGQKHDDGLS